MTKATEAAVFFIFITSIYIGLWAGVFPVGEKIKHDILPYLPFWGLVSFGSYALATLGWGVYTFKDKEAKYKELLVQIDEAKEFYKSKGIKLE